MAVDNMVAAVGGMALEEAGMPEGVIGTAAAGMAATAAGTVAAGIMATAVAGGSDPR